MTYTPRTDMILIANDMDPTHISLINHSRELERELNAANEKIRQLEEENDAMRADLLLWKDWVEEERCKL